MSTAPAGSSLLAAARTRSLTLSPPGRLVAALLALLIAALYAPTAQAACDASYATQPAVTIKLGLFLRGDYESVRIRNAVTVRLVLCSRARPVVCRASFRDYSCAPSLTIVSPFPN